MTIKWWKDQGFLTKRALEERIREMINETPDESFISDNNNKELLIWVLSHHHEYSKKTNYTDVFKLQVRRSQINRSNKELWIVFEDRNESVDISWRKALAPKGKSTKKEDLRNATVQAIKPQIDQFKDNNTDFTCCLCNEIIESDLEACHFSPRFDDLLTQHFGDDERIENIVILDGEYAARTFQDERLKFSWIE